MALKNPQYDTIMREYYRRQLTDKRQQDERRAEAFSAVPELKEIGDAIASLSVEQGRKLLNGDRDALGELKEQLAVLGERRRHLLASHGFPEDFLDMHYTCPDCQDTGYIGNERCHCFKKAVIDLLYTQSNLSEILETENFDHFSFAYYSDTEINPTNQLTYRACMERLVERCRSFISHIDERPDNFFLHGKTGVGKTFLAHCIARELLASSHSVIYFTSQELFDLFSRTAFHMEDPGDEFARMHSYIFDCDLLIIDDLGTELTNSFVASQLFLCINERLSRRRSTIISTNLPLNIFRDTYSDRVFSRITSSYQIWKIYGDDIRIIKKKQQLEKDKA